MGVLGEYAGGELAELVEGDGAVAAGVVDGSVAAAACESCDCHISSFFLRCRVPPGRVTSCSSRIECRTNNGGTQGFFLDFF